jgi:sulfite reductase beta subunit-like hemoprotein
MAAPDIPAVKRAGLVVDLDRLAAEGDDWLTPEDRYALKTYGVCAQLQEHMFMIRVRVPGGVLPSSHARALAPLARRYGHDWVHVTTRQNLELHHVLDREVPDLLSRIERAGLSTRAACGHTLRNVMCSEDAGVSLDEPFDCFPDARAVSDAIVARARQLNCELPSRVNLAFGGSPRCREDALVNDGSFVSSVGPDGEPGYELWAGGSLGKSPFLAVRLSEFVPRTYVVAAAEALIEVFVAHGDFEHPAKARMKFMVETLGAERFRQLWEAAFAAASNAAAYQPVAVEVVPEGDRVAVLGSPPAGGWSAGVRPQLRPGRVTVVVDVPMGDLYGNDLEAMADLADRYGDGSLTLSRDQNVMLRNVDTASVARVRDALVERGLHLAGEAHVASVRACTGSAVCALGITTAPDAGSSLLGSPSLGRNSTLRVHVSGCPNSCAQHQIGDIGLAGSKVRIDGVTRDGYLVFLGADLARRRVGEVVGRVAAEDVGVAAPWSRDAGRDRQPPRPRRLRRPHRRHPGRSLGVRARTDRFAGGRRPPPRPHPVTLKGALCPSRFPKPSTSPRQSRPRRPPRRDAFRGTWSVRRSPGPSSASPWCC